MANFWKRMRRHPFPVVAWFDRVVAISFAFPQEVLRPLIRPPLEIDARDGLGFVTVALVWTRDLRPAGFPRFLGQDFFLAGYRIFTRLRDERGRRLRGLRILRSETDKARMVFTGNLLTHYRYRRIALEMNATHGREEVRTSLPEGTQTLRLVFDPVSEQSGPPASSPFPDWHSARQFAGPMPFTFDDEGDGRYVVIEGKRQEWTPRPIAVESWEIGLFNEEPFRASTPVLANAFLVEGVPYRWERGRVVVPQAAPPQEVPIA